MYQNIYYQSSTNTVHIWDDDIGYHKIKYKKYAYKNDSNGEFTTLGGTRVAKISNWEKDEIAEGVIHEHDIPVTTRILVDRYTNSEELSGKHNIMFLDIEVAKEGKYSTAAEARNKITAIAWYLSTEKVYKCFALAPSASEKENVRLFTNEQDLLIAFLEEYRKNIPTIITGWNVEYYDMLYLYNRLIRVLGPDSVKKLSPVYITEMREQGKDSRPRIAGVSILDYLYLYKKFNYSEEPRYTLDAIAKKELGKGKIEYDGDLQVLYETDIDKFIEYNIHDVRLVVELDSKLDFIEIARGICHKGRVPYEDIIFTSRYLEGAALTYCKQNNIVSERFKSTGTGQAEGAFVKIPDPGIYEYVYDLDLTSLYPMTIISLNISPETLVGVITDWDEKEYIAGKDSFSIDFKQNTEQWTRQKLVSEIERRKWCVASNGAIYDCSVKGLIPEILDGWFDERKKYSSLANEYHTAGDHSKYKYYDKKQLVTKILLNSFYGVLLLPSFRFYNKVNGEAVTLTGQSVINYSRAVANSYYSKRTQKDIDYCIYVDTDSLFMPALPLVELTNSVGLLSGDELIAETLKITSAVQDYINSSYTMYAQRMHFINDHRWHIKQEMVGKRAFWGSAKKRYAIHVVNEKGVNVDKLEIKGFDVVRSSFPASFRSFMKSMIIRILNGDNASQLNTDILEFKKKLPNESIYDILLPSGVKEISKYAHVTKGTPIHVKSAQNYNKLLTNFELTSYPPITDGDKILYGYILTNKFKFETFALRGYDDPPEFVKFVEMYIDRNKIFESALISKLQTLWDGLGWGEIILNQTSNKFFN